MRVRIITVPTEASVDGVALSHFKVGLVYSIPASLATLMIVEGWAEPVMDGAPPTLPAIAFDIPRPHERRHRVLTDKRLRVELGIAADRRRSN